MVNVDPSAVSSRLSRLVNAVEALRMLDLHDPTAPVSDAVATALNAFYDTWEIWCKTNRLESWRAENDAAGKTDDGWTAVALVFARGDSSHAPFVDFGYSAGFGQMPFGTGPFGGSVWCWQDHANPKYSVRTAVYAERVAGRVVTEPFEAALRWAQAELANL